MILADTSLWIAHFREKHADLSELLNDGQIILHPFILGELSCGNFKNRKEVLSLLDLLPIAEIAEHQEVLQLIESRKLYGRGLGWIDVHIIASCLLSDAELWTLDKPLRTNAAALGISVI